jgi:hypothetical protein
MKRLKMDPHGMGRIGHTPMGERVCGEKVAIFIPRYQVWLGQNAQQ